MEHKAGKILGIDKELDVELYEDHD